MSIAGARATPPRPVVRGGVLASRWFYVGMGFVALAICLYAFGIHAEHSMIHPDFPRPWVMYAHGLMSFAWMVLFIAQSWLVQAGNRKLHRTLGWASLVFGVLMPVFGAGTALVMRYQHTIRFHERPEFIFFSFSDIAVFTALFWSGVILRKQPQAHQRLMFLATCCLTVAAFGRIPPQFAPNVPSYYMWVDLLIAVGLLRDVLRNGRIHEIYMKAVPLVAAEQFFGTLIYYKPPHFWSAWANWLAGPDGIAGKIHWL
jgi:hypothetical protein